MAPSDVAHSLWALSTLRSVLGRPLRLTQAAADALLDRATKVRATPVTVTHARLGSVHPSIATVHLDR